MKKKVLIIGGGRGGTGMLSMLSHYHDSIEVIGIADLDSEAQGIKIAKVLGIPSSTDYRDFLKRDDLDLIMNLTEDERLPQELSELKPNIEVLGGASARLVWNIAVDHRRREEEKSKLATELEIANARLTEAMEIQKNVIEHSPDIIITTERDMRTIRFVNSGAEKLLGYCKSEVLGKSVDLLYMNVDEREMVLNVLSEKGSLSNYETVLKTKSGKLIDISLTMSYLLDGTGERIGTVGISKDITNSKKLETDLKESNKELESFVYTVSHDLKAPLRAIYGFSGFLLEDYVEKVDEDGKHFLDRIRESAQLMKCLIDDLLELSRVGRSAINFEEIDTNELFNKSVAANSFQIDEKKGHVSFSNKLPVLTCDSVRFVQLFSNLINNGLKYSSPDRAPEISVGCEEKDKEWVFNISDNGIGIAKENKKRIFEIFQRLHHSDEYDGTGIGLTIVKKILDIHHGKVWVESEPDQGSTFFFSIPKKN